MKHIYKKISLEPYKARIPNTLPSYSGGNLLNPCSYEFFFDIPNGVYNAIPSDIQIPDELASGITDNTSVSINLHKPIFTDELKPNFEFYSIKAENYTDALGNIQSKGQYITVSGNSQINTHRYLSYQKLHKWYRFFVEYFELLNNTTCNESSEPYDCAVSYYYSDNVKSSGETLDYFKQLDETFISRGGTLGYYDEGEYIHASCPLYDWMRDYIFMSFDVPFKYQDVWKFTKFNINTLFQWYSWFSIRYKLYGEYETADNCINAWKDNNPDTDCCDCQEYYKLGGNEMYEYLKEKIDVYFTKANVIQELATESVTLNIPIQISTSDSVLGELSPFIEEWEGGVDYSNQLGKKETADYFGWKYPNTRGDGFGTIVHYGGESYLNESTDNVIIDTQDSTFVANGTENKGYVQNKYRELTFLKDEKPVFDEYIPHYITNDISLHENYQIGWCSNCEYDGLLEQNGNDWVCPKCGTKIETFHDTLFHKYRVPHEFTHIEESRKTYAYKSNKIVINPSIDNMSVKYNITKPDNNNLHFYYIKGNVYQSVTANTITINAAKNTKLIVQYADNDTNNEPFVEYNGGKYFGYYDIDAYEGNGGYKFTFFKKPCRENQWFYIDEDIVEYVIYKGKKYYASPTDHSVIIDHLYKMRYLPFYGYIEINDFKLLLNTINGKISLGKKSEEVEDDGSCVKCEIDVLDEDSLGKRINDTSSWNNKYRGYYLDNESSPTIVYYIVPYTVNSMDYVTGITQSQMVMLEDTYKYRDKLGNELYGTYCGSGLFPDDDEILDITYHIGNTHNLSFIIREQTSDGTYEGGDKVCCNQDANGADYYWGDVISEVTFYFLANDGTVLYDDLITNDYITSSITDNYFDSTEANKGFKQNIDIINNVQTICDKYWEKYCQNNFKEGEQNQPNPYQLLCRIRYNVGAIIKRPFYFDGSKYLYGISILCKGKYHQGIEYTETFTVNVNYEKYYLEDKVFYDVGYYYLSPENTLTYYFDIETKNQPDEKFLYKNSSNDDDELFSANSATFKVQINSDLTTSSSNYSTSTGTTFTTMFNSTESDGRQFNFYNGLMAAPNIVEEYNIGISSLRNVNEQIYVDRGSNYMLDRHLKLLEVKSFEALEQYGNGFFNIINNNND